MITLIFWVLIMVATGNIAFHYNRSVLLWVILSFFFGFIPLIILAFIGEKSRV